MEIAAIQCGCVEDRIDSGERQRMIVPRNVRRSAWTES
jgi:hypothetical protein